LTKSSEQISPGRDRQIPVLDGETNAGNGDLAISFERHYYLYEV
jgi:hypothetical protein